MAYTFRKMRVLLHGDHGQELAVAQLVDISASEATLSIDESIALPETFLLAFSAESSVERVCTTVWRDKATIGVRFLSKKTVVG
jgi:hypothetical protein